MVALVDSDIVIDALKGEVAAGDLFVAAIEQENNLYGSTVTKAEVLAGAKDSELDRTVKLLSSISWIAVSEEIAERAGSLARVYRKSHSGIDMADYLIAATAQELELELCTRNVKHFPMFDGLQSPY